MGKTWNGQIATAKEIFGNYASKCVPFGQVEDAVAEVENAIDALVEGIVAEVERRRAAAKFGPIDPQIRPGDPAPVAVGDAVRLIEAGVGNYNQVGRVKWVDGGRFAVDFPDGTEREFGFAAIGTRVERATAAPVGQARPQGPRVNKFEKDDLVRDRDGRLGVVCHVDLVTQGYLVVWLVDLDRSRCKLRFERAHELLKRAGRVTWEPGEEFLPF